MADVKSAARAIKILEHLQNAKEPQSLKQFCELYGYPHSSMSVLLKTMTKMGYLNYDRSKRLYFPTLKVTSLGDWLPSVLFGRGRALQIMRDLHSEIGETVVIATKNDINVQYIRKLESRFEFRFDVEEGMMKLMTHSAVGWLLMTAMKDDEIEDLTRRANIAAGRGNAVSVQETLERVRETRRQGYGYAENTPFLGAATICVMLPTVIQDQPVVLACGGVLERMRNNKKKYTAAMRRCVKIHYPDPIEATQIDVEF